MNDGALSEESGLHVWFFFTKASFTTRLTKEPERETGSWEGSFPGSQKHVFLLIVKELPWPF